ncbi:hypothetical protein [Halomonas caseinilytica]|nr:hypothetical protein [Halomonas caseinilytica]SEN66064.1 hypothetical protein SAMN04487952_12336 [Halomonas caseinilytica]
MSFDLGQCEQCDEAAVAVSEDSEALCQDCIFEQTCEDMFGDPREDDE